jgi:cytidine deaminase
VRGGSNIEIGNLTLTKHAEEVAILSAFADESEPEPPPVSEVELAAIYIAGSYPCGSCRQFAAEFASKKPVWVIDPIQQQTLRNLSLLDLPDEPEPLVVPFDKLLPSPFILHPRDR